VNQMIVPLECNVLCVWSNRKFTVLPETYFGVPFSHGQSYPKFIKIVHRDFKTQILILDFNLFT